MLLWRNWIACNPPKIKEQVRVLSAVPNNKENDMGFRFRKSFKIAPGIRMSIGKKGASFSTGVKGFRINSKGSVSVGKGPLTYHTNLNKNRRSGFSIWTIFFIIILIGFFIKAFN